MQVGSLVETVADFSEERGIYNIPYPEKGDILIVSQISDHPNPHTRKKGIVLLHFEELPQMIGICDKQDDGTPNFIELLPPIQEPYQETYPHAKEIKKPKFQPV